METFISIKKAADMLGVTALTLRNWDKKGKLTPLRHPINNYRVYRLDDIQKLVEEIGKNTTAQKTLPPKNKKRKLNVRHLDDSESIQ